MVEMIKGRFGAVHENHVLAITIHSTSDELVAVKVLTPEWEIVLDRFASYEEAVVFYDTVCLQLKDK